MSELLEYFITVFWSILEFLSCFIFFHAFFPSKHRTSWHFCSFLVVAFIMSVYSSLGLGTFPKYALTICSATAWSVAAFRGNWLYHLLVVIVSYFFSGIVDSAISYGTCAILGITFNEMIWKKLLYIFVVTCAKLISIFIAYLTYRLHSPSGWQPVKGKWLLLTVLFPIVSLVMILLAFETNQTRSDITWDVFLACCILAIANIATLYLIHTLEKNTKKEIELILLNQQMDLQAKNILSLEKSYRAQRQAIHDFRNQLQTISDLLAVNKVSSANEYINQLQETQNIRVFCINTRHPIVDAVLNQKYQQAVELSIEMNFQVSDLSQVNLSTNALVVLLSNLLDNAIEACQKLSGERAIHCKITTNDTLFLSISNTSEHVQIVDNQIETTKFPREEHGYGLANIKNILNQLNAEYTFDYCDGWFHFVAEIPY